MRASFLRRNLRTPSCVRPGADYINADEDGSNGIGVWEQLVTLKDIGKHMQQFVIIRKHLSGSSCIKEIYE